MEKITSINGSLNTTLRVVFSNLKSSKMKKCGRIDQGL